MIKKLFLTILLIAIMLAWVKPTSIFANEEQYSYDVDLETVDDLVKTFITSINIDVDKNLYINKAFVGKITTDPQTLKYITTNYTITATVSLSKLTCDIDVDAVTKAIYQISFKFDLNSDHDQIITFFPDSKTDESESHKPTKNGNILDFGTFTHTYKDEEKSFHVVLDESTGKLYINDEYIKTIEISTKSQAVYLEYLQSATDLELDYLDSLPKLDWNAANSSKAPFSLLNNNILGIFVA